MHLSLQVETEVKNGRVCLARSIWLASSIVMTLRQNWMSTNMACRSLFHLISASEVFIYDINYIMILCRCLRSHTLQPIQHYIVNFYSNKWLILQLSSIQDTIKKSKSKRTTPVLHHTFDSWSPRLGDWNKTLHILLMYTTHIVDNFKRVEDCVFITTRHLPLIYSHFWHCGCFLLSF